MRTIDQSPYITIHGPDGVGKTTVGRGVATKLVNRGYATEFFDDWRERNGWVNPYSLTKLNAEFGTDLSVIALQAAKTALDSLVINELTTSGITIVKDRGVIDVRADLIYRGLDPSELRGPLMREPDLAVLLTVSEEVRHRRLNTKNDIQPQDYEPNLPGNRMYDMNQSILDQLENRPPESQLILSTDNLSIREVVDEISNEILKIL
jgi:thymidylate kinase